MLREIPEKYKDISFTPPEGMQAAARRGIELHDAGYSGDGLKSETVRRAHAIAAGETLTPDHVREMAAWFARHESNINADSAEEKTPAYVAWMLWGGDAGKTWSEKVTRQMDAADQSDSTRSDCADELSYVRSIGAERITGYIARWGSPDDRDCYGTFFDKENPPYLGLIDGAPFRLLYEHGKDPEVRRRVIGKVTRVWMDDYGIAFNGELFADYPGNERVRTEVREGKLATSSASADHLADFTDDGQFADWLLSELSLTKYPCEHKMKRVSIIRSLSGAPTALTVNEAIPAPIGSVADDCGCGEAQQENVRTTKVKAKRGMLTLAELGIDANATFEDALAALKEKVGEAAAMAMLQGLIAPAETDAPPMSETAQEEEEQQPMTRNDEMAKLRAEMELLKASVRTTNDVPTAPRTAPRIPNAQVSEPRVYWGASLNDMLFGHMVMRSRGIRPSEEFMRVMAGRTVNAIQKGDKHLTDPAVRSLIPSTRANEVATSTAAGGGDEWVSIAWSTQIWEKARDSRIYQELVGKGMRVVEVPQGSESIYITTEGADPTVYTISQDADLAASGRPDVNVGVTRIGTGRALLSPGELGMAVVYSDVFEEDSIIPVMAQYNAQMLEKAEETVEQLLINGDTETSNNTNINLIDGTPGTGLSTPYYIASNGALKYALVTGSGTSRDGGALDENDYRLTMKLMPSAIRSRLDRLAFIIDPDTHSASLDIPAVKTDDVRRTNATITSGVLQNIYGVSVYVSGFMPLANSAGKVPNAGGTLGRILCIYAPYWAVGWKRRVTVETDRDILSGTNIIVAKMRLGFLARGAGASTVSYNLTV